MLVPLTYWGGGAAGGEEGSASKTGDGRAQRRAPCRARPWSSSCRPCTRVAPSRCPAPSTRSWQELQGAIWVSMRGIWGIVIAQAHAPVAVVALERVLLVDHAGRRDRRHELLAIVEARDLELARQACPPSSEDEFLHRRAHKGGTTTVSTRAVARKGWRDARRSCLVRDEPGRTSLTSSASSRLESDGEEASAGPRGRARGGHRSRTVEEGVLSPLVDPKRVRGLHLFFRPSKGRAETSARLAPVLFYKAGQTYSTGTGRCVGRPCPRFGRSAAAPARARPSSPSQS